jgi:tRNA 2-thiouridine synthesizing protein A
MSSSPVEEPLDLRGLKCPLPALLAKRAVLKAAPGALFEILCDDALCHIDLPHMARQEGFEILTEQREVSLYRLRLRR